MVKAHGSGSSDTVSALMKAVSGGNQSVSHVYGDKQCQCAYGRGGSWLTECRQGMFFRRSTVLELIRNLEMVPLPIVTRLSQQPDVLCGITGILEERMGLLLRMFLPRW
mmetsp:Transcript_13345/g.53288  ORF Transcript_13345/g.53288 Transcript_13345/m.53288 type:complete len:109 (+) Transcript_13345:4036-4362(+)